MPIDRYYNLRGRRGDSSVSRGVFKMYVFLNIKPWVSIAKNISYDTTDKRPGEEERAHTAVG